MQESIQAGDAAFVVVTQIFRPFVNLSIRGQNRALLVVAGRNEWDEGTKNGPDRSALLGHNFVYQETKPHGFYSSYFHQRISS